MYEDSNLNTGQAEKFFHEAYEKHMQGKVDEAIKLYQQSLEKCPTAEAHTFLGWAYSFKGRYDDAIAECKQAIDLDPDFGNPYNDIGAYLIEKGQYDDAVEWLEKAVVAKELERATRSRGGHRRWPFARATPCRTIFRTGGRSR